jgi:plastocyanin
MKVKAALAIVSIGAAVLLTACGGDDSGDTSSGGGTATAEATEPSASEPAPSGEAARSEKVEIVDFAFDPDPVVVQVGGKVTWINQDSVPHTATADDGSFDTGTLAEGKLKSETFKQAGTYTYICQIHPTMLGTLEVVERN